MDKNDMSGTAFLTKNKRELNRFLPLNSDVLQSAQVGDKIIMVNEPDGEEEVREIRRVIRRPSDNAVVGITLMKAEGGWMNFVDMASTEDDGSTSPYTFRRLTDENCK